MALHLDAHGVSDSCFGRSGRQRTPTAKRLNWLPCRGSKSLLVAVVFVMQPLLYSLGESAYLRATVCAGPSSPGFSSV